ncbi:MAG: DUF4412 domain-containing protein [Archangium sp.]
MRKLLVAFVFCLASAAWADMTMVSEVTSSGRPSRTVTLSVKGPLALFEFNDGAATRTMLRDGGAKKMYAINHEKKELVVITEEDGRELEARQEAFRAQLKAQLEKLPPEQRARMEATMLGPQTTGTAKAPSFTYEKKKTAVRKVNGFSCQDYVVKREGVEDGEGCFATWKDIGMTAEDFKKTMEGAMPNSSSQNMMTQVFDAQAAAPGFPVWRQRLDRDGNKTESVVKSFTKTSLAAEKFVLPKGYAQKSMGDALKAPPAPAPVKKN